MNEVVESGEFKDGFWDFYIVFKFRVIVMIDFLVGYFYGIFLFCIIDFCRICEYIYMIFVIRLVGINEFYVCYF